MPLSVGTRLGPYEITASLGAGGMGEVYRARDERLGRDVAIKVVPPEFSADHRRSQLDRGAEAVRASYPAKILASGSSRPGSSEVLSTSPASPASSVGRPKSFPARV